MPRKTRSLGRRASPGPDHSSFAAKGTPRWRPSRIGIALIGVLVLFLGLAPSSLASIDLVAQWGSHGSGDGQLDQPAGIAVAPSGNVYVVESGNDRVQQFDSSGAFISKWGGMGTANGAFNDPRGITTDSSGNVWVADYANSRIQKFDSSGSFLLKRAAVESGDVDFFHPVGVATFTAGDIYVAEVGESAHARVQQFSTAGVFNGSWGYGPGPGDYSFYPPTAIATDSARNIYVADAGQKRIQEFDDQTRFVRTWGSAGTGAGRFENPVGVATDPAGNLYVADSVNDRIEKFNPSGSFVAQWDRPTPAGGPFGAAWGLATDSSDNVYVTDYGNDQVDKFHLGDTPPETAVTGGPTGVTNDPTPSFSVSSAQPFTTIRCKVDSAPYAPCGASTRHLADGAHTFYARASDPGATDPTPATRAFTVRTASVRVASQTLIVNAAAGAGDNLRITRPSAGVLRVTDTRDGPYEGSGVHVGAGCTRIDDHSAKCHGAAAGIRVEAGDEADKVDNATGVPSSLFGGAGDDSLAGGSGRDTLTGGMGADVLRGLNGNDLLLARDLTSDAAVNCDGGSSPGSADSAELDKLPDDPNSVVKGCETKTRH